MAETLDLVIRAQNQASAALNGLRGTLDALNKDTQAAGAALSIGVTAPFTLFAKKGLDTMAQFSQSMAQIETISGANEEQLQRLTDTAIRLGAETSFSANEAAGAMLELLKAGLDTEQTLSAIPGVLSLAAAGGVDLAYAANLTAASLNTFGLEAKDAEYVSNLLAAAANASSANISDLAMGLQQGGFAFNAANQDVDDLAASLAILTNVGLTGSDAGTALKNAFMRMISPTKDARVAMEQYGISFFDAQGNMRPLADIIDNLNSSLGGLTEEQRLATLETLFLSDGMKAMIPLLEIGKDGYLEMKDAVNEAGAAQKMADARMRGLAGAFEYTSGSIESGMLKVWQPFEMTIANLVRRGGDFVTWATSLPRPIINAALAFTAVLAAAGPLLLFLPQIIGFFAAMASPIGWVVLALAGLAAAWAANVGGIRDFTAEASRVLGAFFEYVKLVVEDGDTLNDWLTHLPESFQPAAEAFGNFIVRAQEIGQAASDLWVAASWIWQGKGAEVDWWWDIVAVFGYTGKEADTLGRRLYDLGVRLSEAIQAAKQGDFEPLIEMIRDVGKRIQQEIPKWQEAFTTWASGVWAKLSPQLAQVWTNIQNWITLKGVELKNKVTEWASSFLDFPQGMKDAVAILQSEWQEITPTIENHVQRFKDAFASLRESLTPLQDAFARLFAALQPWLVGLGLTLGVVFIAIGAAISALLVFISSFVAEMGTIFTTLVDGLAAQVEIINSTFQAMFDFVMALVSGDWATAWESAKTILWGFVATVMNFGTILWGVMSSMFTILKNTVIGILEDMGIDAKQIIVDMRTGIRMSIMMMKLQMQTEITAIKTGLIADFMIIKSSITESISSAVSAVVGKFNELKSAAATAIDGLRTTVEEKFNGIKTWIEGLKFTNPFSQVMDWAKGAVDAVGNAVGAVTGANGQSANKAAGTMNWRGGPVTLNERGTELIALPGRNRQTWLPRGSRIIPAEQVPLMGGGGGVTVVLNATVTGDADEERLAWRVANIIRRNS